MGLYSGQILPRFLAWSMSGRRVAEERAPFLAGISGRVLELGFGAGLNLPFFSPAVSELLALEPEPVNRKLAAPRIARAPFPVRWLAARGEQVPLDAHSVDAVVSTWTLCSIPDLERALSEVARLLRPGGRLHFIEHGLSPEAGVARWQRRLEPLQKRLFGGCHLTREIDRELSQAGFRIDGLEAFYARGPKVMNWTLRGSAIPEG